MSDKQFTRLHQSADSGSSRAGNGAQEDATGVTNLLNLTPADALTALGSFMAESGQPAYRARQVLRHLWVNPAASFDAMSDQPRELRDLLASRFTMPRLHVDFDQQSVDGTRKFLFRLRGRPGDRDRRDP